MEEWIQSFPLPIRQLPSESIDPELQRELQKAKSIRQLKTIVMQYLMKNGVQEHQARADAEKMIDHQLEEIRSRPAPGETL